MDVVRLQSLTSCSGDIQRRITSENQKKTVVTECGFRTHSLYIECYCFDSHPWDRLYWHVSPGSAMKISRYVKIGHSYLSFIQKCPSIRRYIIYAIQTAFLIRLRAKTTCTESKIRLSKIWGSQSDSYECCHLLGHCIPTFFLSCTSWLGLSFMSTPSLHYPRLSLKKVFF
jgi:hypothetical protein